MSCVKWNFDILKNNFCTTFFRSSFRFGDIVQMIDPLMNPFNITSADEDNEFDYEPVLARFRYE